MKHFLLISLSALLLWSCGNKNQFSITGKVEPAMDGKMVLYGFKEGQPVPVDTTTIEKGKFTFQGEVEIAEIRLLAIEGQNNFAAQLFIEPAKISMTVYPDSFETNVIKGSKSQDIFQKYIDEMITFSEKAEGLKSRFAQAQATTNQEEMAAVQYEYETMIENNMLFARNFVKEYKSSPVAAYVYMQTFLQEDQIEAIDSMLEVFKPIEKSEFITVIKDYAEQIRPFSKGAIAPDFTLAKADGSSFTLSSLKGKYVLVDFWASWCKPCMVDMPNVIELYKTYKDKGFEIVGVSLDREKEAWLNTIKTPGMEWIHVWDMDGDVQGGVATKFGVTGIPHTVLLDKEGKIIEINLRSEGLQAKLSQLL